MSKVLLYYIAMQPGIEREVICPILVGREACMDIVRARLDSAAGGSGATVLVAAEAGVGKSRLVREAAALARQQGFLVLQGTSFETEQALPFAPFIDLLRSLLSSDTNEAYGSALNAHASDLARLLPEEPALRAAQVSAGQTQSGSLQLQAADRAPSLGPQGDKHRLISTFASIFAQLASIQPLMLVLEDLHWSDDISLELFIHIARRVPQQRIVLVATYRDDEPLPALLHALAELDRARLALGIHLAPLSPAEVDAMLRAIFDLHRPVQLDFLNKICELTEGNPFFIEEMLKSLLASGDIVYADIVRDHNSLMDDVVPRTVQDAVQRRSRLLSREAQRILALAAVLGRRFSFDLLLTLLQTGEGQLLELIKECIAAQLIVEESAEHFAFRHALTRQAIYSQLLARERRTLHGEIARLLAQRQEQTGGITPAELARHSYAAGIWEQALAHARRAGEEAQALYAHGPAVEYFSMALDATSHLGGDPSPDLYRARGLSYCLLGNFEAALSDHTEVLRLARQVGDRRGEWQSLLDLAALWSSRDYRETHHYSSLALDLARSMDDPSTLAHTLNHVGNWWMNANEPDEALRFHEEALSVFETSAEKPGIAATLGLLGSTAMFNDDLVKGAYYLRRAIELYRELGDQIGPVHDLASLALCAPSLPTGTAVSVHITLQEAVRYGQEALQIARDTGWRSAEAFVCFTLATCYGALGNYSEAFAYARMALDIAQEIAHTEWMVAAQDALGVLYAAILAFPRARLHLEESWSLAHEIGSLHWILESGSDLARTLIACGDLSQAEVVLDGLLTADTRFKSIGERLYWSARAELVLARSQSEQALEIVDRLLASMANLLDGPAPLHLLKIQGEALIMLGRTKEAEAILLLAESTARSQGAAPLLWRLNLSLGDLYRAQGKRSAAAGHYAICRSVTEELAKSIADASLREGFLKEVAKLLPQLRPVSAARAAKEALGGLTAREREVAALVSRGYTNRQIGEQLHITEETAAVHVKNILSKLNFTSRAQIAAWAAEHSL